MKPRIGAAVGEEVAQKPRPQATYHPPTGSPRNPVPEALVQVITALLDDEQHSYRWAVLREMRNRLCRLYKLPVPTAPASVSEQDWEDHPDEEIPE